MATELLATLNDRAKNLFAATLGIRFVEAAPDRIVAEMDVTDAHCTVPGIAHGGAIMGFADTLGGTATGINLPPGAGTTTIESKTNFFAPGRAGETVRGECVALHRGKRTMVWQTRVTNKDGRLLALVTQTQIVLDPQKSEQEQLTALFAGKSLAEQKALLANLERAGAGLYRAFAQSETDATAKEALLAAARREEENAEVLEQQAPDASR
jgi:uncharacterized protein (TIGR00369 family)